MMNIITLRKQFVEAIDNGDFETAQATLLKMGDIYREQGGFNTLEEAVEFESVVKWFDAEIVEKGYAVHA